MSAILKFDFQKRKQLRFSEVNYPNYTKKRPNFACGNYIFPKTRGNKNKPWTHSTPLNAWTSNAGFRLACRLPHCRFHDDICSTPQAPLAAEGWPSGKQRQANRSITLPLCPPRQIADSWILFNSGAMPLGDKAKAELPLRAATLKQQAMITRHSGKAASGKLVWNQHMSFCIYK